MDIRDYAGNTPLYMTCIYNHIGCARLLITVSHFNQHGFRVYKDCKFKFIYFQNGASVNIRNRAGDSPLHMAVKWKNIEIIELLIDFGAMAYYKNHDGVTPVDISNQVRLRIETCEKSGYCEAADVK